MPFPPYAALPQAAPATVDATGRWSAEANTGERHDCGNGRARYEEITDENNDNLIDIQSGKVVEFQNQEIEVLQEKIAAKYGFKLVGHRLELYGVPTEPKKKHARRRSGGKGNRGSA